LALWKVNAFALGRFRFRRRASRQNVYQENCVLCTKRLPTRLLPENVDCFHYDHGFFFGFCA
jgi:hypothetical protein